MSDTPVASQQAETEPAQPVLVAVDFSDDSRAAVVWACQFAECVGAQLILLHVVHDPASGPGFYRYDEQVELLPIQDVASAMMDQFRDEMIDANPGLDVLQSAETRLIDGLPPGRIVEIAEQLDARLIVIGSRGMTGLTHLMLGSVAERVVELSARPVVVVKDKSRMIGKKLKKKNWKKKNKAGK